MYSHKLCLTVKYKGITLECECTVSATEYQKYRTSKEDVIESVDTVLHATEDIQAILSDDAIDEIWDLCYEEYFNGE